MLQKWMQVLVMVMLVLGLGSQARAELFAVSPTPEQVAGSAFPEWYQDFADPAASADANPDYGIGPTAGGLSLELCLDQNGLCLLENPNPALPISFPNNFGPEAFWWTAEASEVTTLPDGTAGGALLVLALEAAFNPEVIAAGNEVAFGRVRIRVDVPVAGTYTVTHPFGVEVFEITPADLTATGGINAINVTDDIGALAAGDFTVALGSNVGPFLFWDADLPVTNAATPGAFYIGNPGVPHRVLGSPLGTNLFRVQGPPGSNLDGAGNDFVETDLFAVTGKVFTAGGTANTAPTAVDDVAATPADTPVMIDVLGNDTFTDVPINPGSLPVTLATTGGGTAEKVVTADGRVRMQYTPAAGFTGADTFTYTVTGFGGMESLPATATVLVEALQVDRAEFRTKLLKWRISGTSSDTSANTIGIQLGPSSVSASLTGDEMVPPVNSTGTGTVSVTIDDPTQTIQFSLSQTGLLNTTGANIHVGSPGQNGPAIFNLAGANFTSVEGTLTAADLIPAAVQGVNTFADAVNAILEGNTYVVVHTQASSQGAIRGQLGPIRSIGEARVQADGSWKFDGKSLALPAGVDTISVRSSNGIRVLDVPVKMK